MRELTTAFQQCGGSCLSQHQATRLSLPGRRCSGLSGLLAASSELFKSSGCAAASELHAHGLRPQQTGQHAPFVHRLATEACHSCRCPHMQASQSHQTTVSQAVCTSAGVCLPIRSGCHCDATCGSPSANEGHAAGRHVSGTPLTAAMQRCSCYCSSSIPAGDLNACACSLHLIDVQAVGISWGQ